MAWLAKRRGQTALFRNGGEKRCLSPGFAELDWSLCLWGKTVEVRQGAHFRERQPFFATAAKKDVCPQVSPN